MLEISSELKDKMLKNAEIMLERELFRGTVDCNDRYNIKCEECPLSKENNIDNLTCLDSGRIMGKEYLQNWYNENKPKENKMEELQTIDTSKWQWMMVSNNGVEWYKRIVFCSLSSFIVALADNREDDFLQNVKLHKNSFIFWLESKPIEQRNNTALDVMWWGGVRKVFKFSKVETIYAINVLAESIDVSKISINELHLIDGHAEIKHEKWLTADELEII